MGLIMSAVRIVGIGGSLAAPSESFTAPTVALDGAREYGAQVQVFDLRELNLPMYSPEAKPALSAAIELCVAAHAAHGLSQLPRNSRRAR
jgi:NAD(P)H-dependent FMN reductase